MRALVLAAALASASTSPAQAGIFVAGSLSMASFNGGLQTGASSGGSGTVGFEFTEYVRLGYTHKRQTMTREGWMGKAEGDCDYQSDDPVVLGCLAFTERTYDIADSFDLTLVLYNGEVVAPFILGGLILKTRDYKRTREGAVGEPNESTHDRSFTPSPNLGGGMHVRLNRQFSLKFQYTVSQGARYTPRREETKLWDKDMSLGVTYQL